MTVFAQPFCSPSKSSHNKNAAVHKSVPDSTWKSRARICPPAWGAKLTKRNGLPQGQGRRRAQARGHSAPHVDGWNRVQLVDEQDFRVARIRRSQGSRDTAGKVVCRDGGGAEIVRFFASARRATALSTLIHQRRRTPSCGGHAPTAERTVGLARMIVECVTPRPGIRERIGRNVIVAMQRHRRYRG